MHDSGWLFPPAFTNDGAGIKTISNNDHIQQSLRNLFTVRPGEREAYPFFGGALAQFIFADIDNQQLISIEFAVKDAIASYEPRISVRNVNVNGEEDNGFHLSIKIDYQILDSAEDDSLEIALTVE